VKKVLALVILMVVGVFGWRQWSANSSSAAVASKASSSPQSPAIKSDALPPSAVFNIDPRMSAKPALSGSGSTPRRGQLPANVSPLMADYIARKDFPALMAKVSQLPNDGEALYIRAQLLNSCAKKTDQTDARPRKTWAERRAEFVASLPQNHPDTPIRINAWDLANPDVCGSLRDLETTKKEIADAFARAQELKDPAALARELNCEILATNDPVKFPDARAVEINDSRVDRIRQAIASRDPTAVRAGVGMLSNTYRNGAFRLGNDGPYVDQATMHHVANLLACQYGGDCVTPVHSACAREGRCSTNNFEDYLAYYELSPSAAQLVESYRRQLTQMIDSGDFSQLQLVKGEQPTDSVRVGSYFQCN
jgi:hypothetical protein